MQRVNIIPVSVRLFVYIHYLLNEDGVDSATGASPIHLEPGTAFAIHTRIRRGGRNIEQLSALMVVAALRALGTGSKRDDVEDGAPQVGAALHRIILRMEHLIRLFAETVIHFPVACLLFLLSYYESVHLALIRDTNQRAVRADVQVVSEAARSLFVSCIALATHDVIREASLTVAVSLPCHFHVEHLSIATHIHSI